MEDSAKGKVKVWTPLLFAIVLMLGMSLGFDLRDSLRNKKDIQTIINRNDKLEDIISLINEKYADTVNTGMLYEDAIDGLLKHLDPHTIYIPADEVEGLNDELDGSFFGIGVEFSIVKDTVQVLTVIENSPAEQSGIKTGDQVIKVEDSIVAGNKITSAKIMHMLKGKRKSIVHVTLKDPVSTKEKNVIITRDAISVHSIDAALKVDDITGYIKINRFSATTHNEFQTALTELKKQGIQQLIIDLRENSGGYLEAASKITDELLDDDKLIVYTKGKNTGRSEYKAHRPGLFETGRLAVLVDESSASASEIVSGALQDWDRAVIVGRRTFGKGLVQEQYDLGDGSAIRLTIARYYTPSGRCIQRTFANGKEAYEKDYEKRFHNGELTGRDSIVKEDTTVFYTSRHRPVHSGGGIKPDVYIPYDSSQISSALLEIIYGDELKTVLLNYFLRNKQNLNFGNASEFEKRFDATDKIIDIYLASLSNEEQIKAKKVLKNAKAAKYFRLQVKAQIAQYLFHKNGYYDVYSREDDMVQKALQVLHSNTYSKIIGR